MPDRPHVLIPYATSASEGCRHSLQNLALPHLERLLARLSPQPDRAISGRETSLSPPHERALARALGLPDEDGRIPWAAWHRQQQGQATQGLAWAFITPCQWQVGTDHVMLRDPQGLDEAASRALLASMSPWFAQDGITLHYDQPTRWLASGALFATLASASLERVLLRDLRSWLPRELDPDRGPTDAHAARRLQRLHSEMQMLLYTHPLNDARAERGLPPINAFWVHGTGTLPTALPATSTPPTVLDTLRDPALHEDWSAWAAAWSALDAGPVAGLLRQTDSGQSVLLTLCGERNAIRWHSARRGWLRRMQSLFQPPRMIDIHHML
ncbi:phosphoglycerate mutase [Verminephrobacter eiseniae]|uniref:phosphoglycerate mutase n=1 Tax=Verminephrobacter eiseniae TaxID=364317 RepID=UPI002238902F|nr:phosphoglycerate mutase [Verminephrobacter eiseniae]MCW5231514.1 phosphoglycerate mutase [Verminephrobacter eiseniae]MCW5293243.1 phosphoglycerate mutase [Verminephrobacter eiseniae]MCW8235108.1 phosphoglycerate mutase [Verminephrobacter eiseniae]